MHKYLTPIATISSLTESLSSKYITIAFAVHNVNNGINKDIDVLYISNIPYSSVDNILVYNGKRKNDRILVAKLLIVKTPMFFTKYLY